MIKFFCMVQFLFLALLTLESSAQVKFENAQIYTPLKGTNVTVAYVTIRNEDSKEVELKLEKFEGFKSAELHETILKDGQAKMQKIAFLKIPSKSDVKLVPGGTHIMLFEPTQVIKPGDLFKASFRSGKSTITEIFKVVSRDHTSVEDHSQH